MITSVHALLATMVRIARQILTNVPTMIAKITVGVLMVLVGTLASVLQATLVLPVKLIMTTAKTMTAEMEPLVLMALTATHAIAK